MKKLCFGSLVTVLVKCKAPATAQKQLVGTMLLSVNEHYDIRDDDGATSALALGRTNLSSHVVLYANDADTAALSAYFRDKILPLLDLNRRGTMILALKDIIAADTDISDDRELELINRQTKAEIITRDTFVFEEFLAGLFLYTAIYTRNNKREKNIKEITDAYVRSFDSRRNEISFVPSYGVGNMELLNDAVLNAKIINLMAEESGLCPCCAKPLQSAQTILIELSSGIDMLFCSCCAAGIQNSPEKKAEYLEVKKRLQSRTEAMDAISSDKIADAVREIIEMIGSGEPVTESELRMSPLKVEEKIADRNLLRKVKAMVVDGIYEMVNEIINQLAAANRLNVRQFERSIKRMYEDAEDSLDSQSDIFNSLVRYLYAKANQKNYEACEILISYFVQRCEVFHEITR
jgi:hypothetical protein